MDGRTDLALLVNVSRPTFFLGRYLVTALQLCARGRKLLIRKKSIRRADWLFSSLAAWLARPHCTRLQLPSATFRFLFRHQKWKWAATWSRNLAPSTVKKNLGSLFNWANRFHGWLEKLYSCNSCNCSEYIVYTSLITLQSLWTFRNCLEKWLSTFYKFDRLEKIIDSLIGRMTMLESINSVFTFDGYTSLFFFFKSFFYFRASY